VYACEFDGIRHDVGDKMGFIESNIEFALQREEIRNQLLDFLLAVLERELIEHAES
jgi:UTP--glucose-1-phosphate uridylyltransferase